MKQTILMIAWFLFCAARSVVDPFWGAFLYYSVAVFRPQAVWRWSLPAGVRWSLFAAIIAAVALAIHAGSPGRRVVRPAFLLLLLGFSVCWLGSHLGAANKEVADKWGLEYVKLMGMLVVGAMVVTQKRHLRYLGWMIFACLTYMVYEVNSLYVFEDRQDLWLQGYAGLDNNGAALLLAMAIPYCYFFFVAARRPWRWGLLACAVPAAHAVMFSYSRGAMVSALTAGAGMLLTSGKRRMRTLLVGAGLAVVVLWLAGPSVRDRFMMLEKGGQEASAGSRLESWQAGLKIALDYPLFGCGIRNADLLSKSYGADRQGRVIHNLYIQVAADEGIPAAILLIALMASALVWLWRGARMAEAAGISLEERSGDGYDASRIGHRAVGPRELGGGAARRTGIGATEEYELRWHQAICMASFWSLVTFMVGAMFLSLELVELPYLLLLMGAVAPGLVTSGMDARGGAVNGRTGTGAHTEPDGPLPMR